MGYKPQPATPKSRAALERRVPRKRLVVRDGGRLRRSSYVAGSSYIAGSYIAIALLICTSLSCRVRNLDDSRRAPSGMTSEAINSPAGIASQPPRLGQDAIDDPADDAPTVQPAVVLAPGFARAGFSAVRQAQREAEYLLPGLEHRAEPWSALAARVNRLVERRWPDERTTNGAFPEMLSVELSRRGHLNLVATEYQQLLSKALLALDVGSHEPRPLADSLSHDWEGASGPLLVLARSSDGEMGAVWFGDAPDTDNRGAVFVSSRVTPSASLAVMCSCATPDLAESGASQLEAVLDDTTALSNQVRELGTLLRAAANDDRLAVLVLSSHGVLAASSSSLAYGVAGNVGRATLPMMPPEDPASIETAELDSNDEPSNVGMDAGAGLPAGELDPSAPEPVMTPPVKLQSVPSAIKRPVKPAPNTPAAPSPKTSPRADDTPPSARPDAASEREGAERPPTEHATSKPSEATHPQQTRPTPKPSATSDANRPAQPSRADDTATANTAAERGDEAAPPRTKAAERDSAAEQGTSEPQAGKGDRR